MNWLALPSTHDIVRSVLRPHCDRGAKNSFEIATQDFLQASGRTLQSLIILDATFCRGNGFAAVQVHEALPTWRELLLRCPSHSYLD